MFSRRKERTIFVAETAPQDQKVTSRAFVPESGCLSFTFAWYWLAVLSADRLWMAGSGWRCPRLDLFGFFWVVARAGDLFGADLASFPRCPVGIIIVRHHYRFQVFHTRYRALYGGKQIVKPHLLQSGKFPKSVWLICQWLLASWLVVASNCWP